MKKRKVKELVVLSWVLILVSTSCSGQESPQNQEKPQGGPPDVEEMFVKMDSNKDGKLSLEEVKGPLKKDFDKIDKNQDGFLSKEEVEAAPKRKKGQRPRR